jgi:hypothetical protein
LYTGLSAGLRHFLRASLDIAVERVFDGLAARGTTRSTQPEVPTMGVMRILDQTGDTTVAWSLADAASVTEAAALFERERCRRVPFARRAGAPAQEAKIVTAFDPTAEEIIWTQPVVAG